MSCRTALISVGLSWAVGIVLLVLLLEGVGVGVVDVVEAPPFMLRSVGPVERESGSVRGAGPWHASGTWHPPRCAGGLLCIRHLGWYQQTRHGVIC